MIRQTFAINAQAMLNPMPTSRMIGLGRYSTVWLFSVRMYQCSVNPGISNRIENGMMTPDMIGVYR